MTPLECIALILFSVLLGIVLGVLISFKLLKQSDEIEKDEWERGDY